MHTFLSGYGVSKAASISSRLGTYVVSKSGSVPEYSEVLIK
ncbi:Fructokinase [Methanosarcina siciliae C2J]|uniref:Fructokinase n=1 Tax=Methanosarcina siciliae C2J TaxID=1434118 RepID=A0A0E3PQ60_9EURY|nr:Fructokinase [Methanosarcina siciliae C2J]